MFISEDYRQIEYVENELGEIDVKSYNLGSSGIYEPFTDDIGRLFRSLQREYGRCDSKVYIDTANGVKAVGWVFVKRQKYSDSNDTYLAETWITLHQEKPTRTVEYKYRYL